MTQTATSLLGEEDEATVRAAYPGPTWDRPRELKRRYDPDNLFRANHNISPADGWKLGVGSEPGDPGSLRRRRGRCSAFLTQPETFAAAC